MLFETPQDTYKVYIKFLKKGEYRKAYRCLEKMLHEFPGDIQLLEEIVDLCAHQWKKPEMSKRWLSELTRVRSFWFDYALLSRVEAELENISQAKEYLKRARELRKVQTGTRTGQDVRKIFSEIEGFIGYKEELKEWNAIAKTDGGRQKTEEKRPELEVRSRRSVVTGQKAAVKDNELKDKTPSSPPKVIVEIPSYSIPVKINAINPEAFAPFLAQTIPSLKESKLFIDYIQLTVQSSFDELLCLNATSGIDKYWYQTETVKRALRNFHGRVLLCDEVGLGKTIEAGMLIKEYFLRGMIRNVLILTPPSLVTQWKEEMEAKFDIEFVTTDDPELMRDPINFWEQRFIIASIHTAKSSKNMPLVAAQFYDLVVVDEAHHLRNRTTLSWKLVNQIKKKFIFLLTATPVQNNLIELFNLITLLNPGQFKTERQFREEYLQKGNLKATANKERLRELLRDVMIRNTRSAIDLKLPKRFATTMRLEPTDIEREIYTRINEYLRSHEFRKPMINLFLREAGSSPFALKQSLLNMENTPLSCGSKGRAGEFKDIINAIDNLEDICKGKALIEILLKNPDEKTIIFTQFIKSVDYITDLLLRHEVPHVTFRGDMSLREKDVAIASFKNETPVLVSTESGGEGRNMQFCNTIINFDLPWNPMRIEQRIGRLHRIGQTRDVFIFNLSIKETIEDYIIEILDNKINMFEMVIGEIEPILGQLGEDRDFEEIIMEIWLKESEGSLRDGFEKLGKELIKAKGEYLKVKTLDSEIFGEDYEI